MSSRERWDALVRGDRRDRVPCLQFILGHTAVVSGKPIAKVYDDAAVSIACQRDAMELYGYDGLVLHGWANAGGAEFGGEIEFPYRKYTGAPMMKRNPVQNEDDAWDLRVPADVAAAGTIPVALEFSRLQYELGMPCHRAGRLAAHLGRLGLRRGAADGLAHQEAGPRPPRAARDHRFHPEEGRALGARSSVRSSVMAFDLCIETNRLYSPKQFETFAFPYLKEVHDRVTEHGRGHLPQPHLRRAEQQPAPVGPSSATASGAW